MNWWHSAFPSSCGDDNYINNRTSSRMSDVISLFSPSRTAGSHHRRPVTVTGSSNLQHFTDDDVAQVPTRSFSTSHTLPLPQLSALLKRDSRRDTTNKSVHQTSKYILPSPKDATSKSVENKGISESNHRDSKGPPRNATVHKKSHFLQKRPPQLNFTASIRDAQKHGETVSAPATPISSPSSLAPTNNTDLSTSNNISPGIQPWPAPEPPSQDMSPGVAHQYHTLPERCVKSPMPSNSPLHKNSSTATRNAQATMATVHPLPLPPGASVIPPFSPIQTNNNPDSVSKKQSRWQKGKLIGRGTFGSVYVGSNRETGALCAMKEVEILPDDRKSAESIKQLQQEIDVLSQLKHPNIVQYYGSEIVEDRFYIYLEYVHPGSINKYVRDHCGGMTESIVRNFTRHIVSGLAYLHSTKTIHRDIKGANLLVDANGVVKLADFGMAKHLDGQVHLSLKGSPYWMAPELLQGEAQKDASPDLALAVDIWSLGCTIIEMMNGKPPWSEFEGPAAMFKVMKETPPLPETMSPDGKDFLRCCFIRNPAERPMANMLLEHRFLNNLSQLDVSGSTSLLSMMKLTMQNRRERSVANAPDTPATKGKLLNNVELRKTNVSF